ncbi:hypothetical protein J4438_01550 [Candidatus Woesearchaeota archaeon]|nr:hypothetical protein [Candidatus Woesearchaeota archaeon]
MESSVMVAIVIILSAIILLIGTKSIADTGEDAVDRESCKASVLFKERSKLLGKPLIDDVSCETNLIDINSKDEIEIKKTIANEMYDCWYQFGQGERDFLDTWDFGKGDNYCFVCSRIDFSEETQKEISQVTGLFDYLSNEPLPLHNQESFFVNMYGEDANQLDSQSILDVYSTDKPLYIVFFADKRTVNDLGSSWVTAGASGLCAAGIVLSPITFGTSAAVGCLTAGIVTGTVYTTTHKNTFVNGLYVGQDSQIMEICQQ